MDKSKARAEDSRIVSTEPLDSKDARWTKLVKVNYKNPLGKDSVWESAERSTRPSTATIDGVGVIALAATAEGVAIVLQKQFRPPVGKVCIEVPAGLLDSGESGGTCAVRELHEETGYVGTLLAADEEEGGVMFNDPGFTNTNLQLIPVSIDLSRPENQTPTPKLEADEFITTFTVLVRDLWQACRRFEAEGYAIDARVGTLAEGVRLASQLGLGSGLGLGGGGGTVRDADAGSKETTATGVKGEEKGAEKDEKQPYVELARRSEELRAKKNVQTYSAENAALG